MEFKLARRPWHGSEKVTVKVAFISLKLQRDDPNSLICEM